MQLKSKAFTLIELLIAVSLLMLIGAAIFRSFSSGIALYSWVRKSKPDADAVIFLQRLSMDLRNAGIFRNTGMSGGNSNIVFYVHEPAYLLKAADELAALQEPSVSRIEYSFISEKGVLIRRSYRPGELRPFRKTVVLDNIRDMRFRYCTKGKNGYIFTDSTKGLSRKIPEAVEIDMGLTNEGSKENIHKIIEIPAGLS